MRNLKLEIEYAGTNYCGWQTQNSAQCTVHSAQKRSIQATIEKALQRIFRERVKLIASGRTDAGVHARAQVANFKTNSNISLEKLQRSLNSLLPGDISISRIEEKALGFHSRFATKSKVYRYTILNRAYPSAFLRNTAYFYPYNLNIRAMQREATALLGRHNFKSFQASDKKQRNPVRTIKKISIAKERDLIHIDIEADGFLYNMARNIVGTLIEIGRLKRPRVSLKKILRLKDRKFAGPTVPACGLSLIEVKY